MLFSPNIPYLVIESQNLIYELVHCSLININTLDDQILPTR